MLKKAIHHAVSAYLVVPVFSFLPVNHELPFAPAHLAYPTLHSFFHPHHVAMVTAALG